MTREAILDIVRRHRQELHTLGVSRIGLYGSCSRGTQTDQSDIDLLLEFHPGRKNFTAYMEACRLLESLFDNKVDIATREAVSPRFLPGIEQDILYETA